MVTNKGQIKVTGKDVLVALALLGAGYLTYKVVKAILEEAEKQSQIKTNEQALRDYMQP